MSHSMSISKARSSLATLSKKLAKETRPDAVAITRKGKPVLALMNWEFYESIVETLEIMADKELMAALRQGIKEQRGHKGVAWNTARKALH